LTEPIPRRAGRVLLLDAAGRVLLFHGYDPARPEHAYWFTPGGGLDERETAAEGAARELFEETGLSVPADRLGGAVRREITEFPFAGNWYRQEQEFFLLRVDSWQVDTVGFSDIERDSVDGHRWWSVEDLDATTERYYPADLADLVRSLADT
jgi:8-oxo-dGTP pyrophosphatase MutT (NUDIX family)